MNKYLKLYAEWAALSLLMLLNVAILAILGIATLLSIPVNRQKFYLNSMNYILMGLKTGARRIGA